MQLQRRRVDYIKPKYLPKGITLRQYYHLSRDEVDAILKHWTRRQAAGKVPFRFRKVARAARRDEDASEESNADARSDMGPGEEAEEDMQVDDVSQAPGGGASRDSGSNGSTDQALPAPIAGNAAENAQHSEAADAYVPQQTGGDVVSDSSHTTPRHTQSRSYTLNEREPSFNEEVSNLDHQIER